MYRFFKKGMFLLLLTVVMSGCVDSQKNTETILTSVSSSDEVKNPKFVLYQSIKDGQFYWNLHAKNGEIIATSEGYTTKASAKTGIASVKKNAKRAKIHERHMKFGDASIDSVTERERGHTWFCTCDGCTGVDDGYSVGDLSYQKAVSDLSGGIGIY